MLVDVVLDSAASEVMAVDGNGVLQKHGHGGQILFTNGGGVGHRVMVRAGLGMCGEIGSRGDVSAKGAAPTRECTLLLYELCVVRA